jgi:hypothetical protein
MKALSNRTGTAIAMSQPLRLAIVSTPRSGNMWLRLMISRFYDAAQVAEHTPNEIHWEALPAGNTVLQLHWHPTQEFLELLRNNNFQVIVLARHPLDVLISILQFSQKEPLTKRWLEGEQGDESCLIGKSPSSEAFSTYAVSPRAASLFAVSHEWSKEPNTIRVRYEDLVHNTKSTLTTIFDVLGRPNYDIDTVISEFSLEKLRPTASNRHFWKGEPGLWKKLIPRSVATDIYNAHSAFFEAMHHDIDGSVELSRDEVDQLWSTLIGLG